MPRVDQALLKGILNDVVSLAPQESITIHDLILLWNTRAKWTHAGTHRGQVLHVPLPAVAPRLHWSTTTPFPGHALTEARSQHHGETCGLALVSVRAVVVVGMLCGLCAKSAQLPLAGSTGAPPRLSPGRRSLSHDPYITARLAGCLS